MHLSRRLSMLVTLLSSLNQAMISLLQSVSFLFVSLSFYSDVSNSFLLVIIKRFKLISSDVSSLFLLDIIKRFKLISSYVSSLFILDISKSVSSSFHQTFQVYFFLSNVIEADSLQMSFKQTHFEYHSSRLTIK